MKNTGLGDLKQFLPYNYRKLIADASGHSRQYVYCVATGRLTNWKLLEQLRQLAEENMNISNKVVSTKKKIKK